MLVLLELVLAETKQQARAYNTLKYITIVTATMSCAFVPADSGRGSTDVLTVNCIYNAFTLPHLNHPCFICPSKLWPGSRNSQAAGGSNHLKPATV